MEDVSGRSLERFFYDWTERPGHPMLEVKTVSRPEERQAEVTVKQTQSGDAFEFPLKIAFTCGTGKPVEVEEQITTKEHTFTVPLPGPLTMVEVDPGQTLLAQIYETKGRDLWLAKLHHAASVPGAFAPSSTSQRVTRTPTGRSWPRRCPPRSSGESSSRSPMVYASRAARLVVTR